MKDRDSMWKHAGSSGPEEDTGRIFGSTGMDLRWDCNTAKTNSVGCSGTHGLCYEAHLGHGEWTGVDGKFVMGLEVRLWEWVIQFW